MGQLKPSEVRLVIAFSLTVLILGSFFLYEWYARELAKVNDAHLVLQAEQTSLLTMRDEEDEYNQKRVWLNEHQPLARSEFEAKDALDRVMAVAGIEAAGLTLVSTPPERPPRMEPYFWAFERRVVVQGDIEGIVRWLATLQSESAFRAITQLHIYPKKRKEPEILTCEVTIEQRYVTEDILNLSNVVLASGEPSGGSAAPPDPAFPAEPGTPASAEGSENAGTARPPEEAPAEAPGRRPVVLPPAAPANANAGEGNFRPPVRLPRPPARANLAPPPEPDPEPEPEPEAEVLEDGGFETEETLPEDAVMEGEVLEEEFLQEEVLEEEVLEEEVFEEEVLEEGFETDPGFPGTN